MATTSAMGSKPPALPQSLVERCAKGDDLAWEALYREHRTAASRFLLRLGVKREALEDTCQEVFLQAFRFLPKFRGDCTFRTWLYKICVSEARRTRRRGQLKGILTGFLSARSSELSSGELGEARSVRLVQEALDGLHEADRLVFVLYELEGLSGREVAEVAECPEATVFRRLHYARKQFTQHIVDQGVTS